MKDVYQDILTTRNLERALNCRKALAQQPEYLAATG